MSTRKTEHNSKETTEGATTIKSQTDHSSILRVLFALLMEGIPVHHCQYAHLATRIKMFLVFFSFFSRASQSVLGICAA
jgi:hypothetical protein